MTQISFYHLTKTSVEEALPKLLEKMLETGVKTQIVFENQQQLENLDKALWSVGGTRFIPHGTEKDDFADQHPVFLTTSNDNNPNSAEFYVSVGKVINDEDNYHKYKRNFVIFNGFDDEETHYARGLWKKLKSNEKSELKYYKQDEKGSWKEE